jgi:hypothetical protein
MYPAHVFLPDFFIAWFNTHVQLGYCKHVTDCCRGGYHHHHHHHHNYRDHSYSYFPLGKNLLTTHSVLDLLDTTSRALHHCHLCKLLIYKQNFVHNLYARLFDLKSRNSIKTYCCYPAAMKHTSLQDQILLAPLPQMKWPFFLTSTMV